MPQDNPHDGGNWGIMGGAFDPIHNGHLILANSAYKAFHLTGVLFLPSLRPPHRANRPTASYEDRIKMVSLAINRNSHYIVSRAEENIDGPGYTLSILEYFQKEYKRVKWFLILGTDNITLFDSWHKPDEIQKRAKIIVGNRPGFNDEFKKSSWADKVDQFEMPMIDISSTQIRHNIKNDISVAGLLPDSVLDYISERGLYK